MTRRHRDEAHPEKNWYDYSYRLKARDRQEGRVIPSYWRDRVGIDRAEPSRVVYAMHCLVGHHGIFSLTPVWLLSVVGAVVWLWQGDRRRRELALLIAAISLVCLAFYLSRGPEYRNYGGITCGLRWMFWFAPLWLLLMLPAADLFTRCRWSRWLALALLIASVLSVAYPTWNPWTHPWLMNYLHHAGWAT